MLDISGIHEHWVGIFMAFTVVIVALMSPGPAILAVIGTAMEKGRKQGVYLALGVVSGSALWGTAAALGISAILVTYSNILIAIKIIGGLYLLWLAGKSFRIVLKPQLENPKLESKIGTPFQMWRAGFILHLTNPKAIIAWIATISLGVTPDSPLWVSLIIVIGAITLSFVAHMAYAFIFSTKRMSSLYLKAKRPIALLFSVFFGFAGIKLLTSRI